MEDIYQVIDDRNKSDYTPEADFDREAWSQKKQQERSDTYEKIDAAAERVNTDPEALDSYLDVMARFPHHSVSNALLIFDQSPEATRIGDSKYWSQQGAHIKKGEKGFTILEPGNEYVREDGSIGTFYNNKKVFDAKQTTTRTRLPRKYDEHEVLSALVTKSPVAIQPADDLQGEFAVYDHAATLIEVQKGLSETQMFWALSSELSHANFAKGEDVYDREANSKKAELAATVLAKRYGIETTVGDAPFPAGTGASSQDIRESLTEIRNSTRDISARVNEVLDVNKSRDRAMER